MSLSQQQTKQQEYVKVVETEQTGRNRLITQGLVKVPALSCSVLRI